MNIKTDLSGFDLSPAACMKLIGGKVQEVATKLTLDIYTNVVAATPVDTGNARANWSVETPAAPFQNGYVENPTEYLIYLEHGHSGQAPNGFIGQAINAAVRGIK